MAEVTDTEHERVRCEEDEGERMGARQLDYMREKERAECIALSFFLRDAIGAQRIHDRARSNAVQALRKASPSTAGTLYWHAGFLFL